MEFNFRDGANRPPAVHHSPSSSVTEPASAPALHGAEVEGMARLREEIRREILREMEEEKKREVEIRKVLELGGGGGWGLGGGVRRIEVGVGLEGAVERDGIGTGAVERACRPIGGSGGRIGGKENDVPVNQCRVHIKRKAGSLMDIQKLSQQGARDWSCALCQVTATCKEGLDEHLNGKKHKAKEAFLNANKPAVEKDSNAPSVKVATFNCSLCQVSSTSEEALQDHINGRKHKAKEARLAIQNTTENEASESTMPKGSDNSLFMVGPQKEENIIEKLVQKDNETVSSFEKAKTENAPGNTSIQKENIGLAAEVKIDEMDEQLVRETIETGSDQKKKKKRGSVWCHLCQVKCNSKIALACHCGGKKHKNKLAQSKSLINNESSVTTMRKDNNDTISSFKKAKTEIAPGSTSIRKEGEHDAAVKPHAGSTGEVKIDMLEVQLVKETVETEYDEQTKRKNKRSMVWCQLCNLKCNSKLMLASHFEGKKHKNKLAQSKSLPNTDTSIARMQVQNTVSGLETVVEKLSDVTTEEGNGENTITHDGKLDDCGVPNASTDQNDNNITRKQVILQTEDVASTNKKLKLESCSTKKLMSAAKVSEASNTREVLMNVVCVTKKPESKSTACMPEVSIATGEMAMEVHDSTKRPESESPFPV